MPRDAEYVMNKHLFWPDCRVYYLLQACDLPRVHCVARGDRAVRRHLLAVCKDVGAQRLVQHVFCENRKRARGAEAGVQRHEHGARDVLAVLVCHKVTARNS